MASLPVGIRDIDIVFPARIIICSASFTGKTVLARQILKQALATKAVKDVHVFSSTADVSGDWAGVPGDRIHSPGDIEALQANIDDCKERKEEAGGKAPSMLLIFDDVLGAEGGMSFDDPEMQKVLNWCFAQGRHYGVSVCGIIQDPIMLKRRLRSNFTHLYWASIPGDGIKHIYSLCDTELSQKEFKRACAVAREAHKYTFLGYDNTRKQFVCLQPRQVKFTLRLNPFERKKESKDCDGGETPSGALAPLVGRGGGEAPNIDWPARTRTMIWGGPC